MRVDMCGAVAVAAMLLGPSQGADVVFTYETGVSVC